MQTVDLLSANYLYHNKGEPMSTNQQAHSIFSPSKAEIFMNCPGSIASQAEAPKSVSSRAAKQGQRAHYLGEICLKNKKEPKDYLFETIHDTSRQDMFNVTEDLVNCVEMYYNFVTSITSRPGTFLSVEIRLGSEIAGEKVFGTCDALVIEGTTLHIIDYKHGGGHAVDAIGNKQMMIYAILASHTLGDFDDIHFAIVQPNAGGEKEWWITRAELAMFEEDLNKAINECLNNPDLIVPGDHCLWCEAKASCGAYSTSTAQTLGTRNGIVILPVLSDTNASAIGAYIEKMSKVISKLKQSLKVAENLAIEKLTNNEEIPGLSLTVSKGQRTWVDQKVVLDHFKDKGDLVFSKEIRSPNQMEKALKLSKKYLEDHSLVCQKLGGVKLTKTWEKEENFDDLTQI